MKLIKSFKIFENARKSYDDLDVIKGYIRDLCGDEYSVIGKDLIVNDSCPNNGSQSKIELVHNKCGHKWLVKVGSFINNGRRCPFCFGTKKQTVDDLIKRCHDLHGDEYKIINADSYVNNKSKISVRHNCGYVYDVVAQNFFNLNSKCPKCSGKLKLTKDDIVNRCGKIYGTDYIPINIENIKNGKSKITMFHKVCGKKWSASVGNILYGETGCPYCSMTTGERLIKKYLDEHNINYEIEFRFNLCRDIRPLPFDFYIKDYNLCIEYDGIQHSEPVNFFGGDSSLVRNKKIDLIKTKFCKDNNINLLRIDYKELSEIYNILDKYFEF